MALTNLSVFAGSLLVLNILSCGSYENPVSENKIWNEAPVKSLNFFPGRKYISANEKIGVQVTGLQLLYQCAYINWLQFENVSSSNFQLDLEVIWPKDFYNCPLAPTTGLDTNIMAMFELESDPLDLVFLLNSEGLVTDSALFAPFPHLSGQKKWGGLDSSLALDSLYSEVLLKDSLALTCGDSLSFGVYCRPSKDSLILQFGYTRGWSESGCIGNYNISLEGFEDWIHALDTNISCNDYDVLDLN